MSTHHCLSRRSLTLSLLAAPFAVVLSEDEALARPRVQRLFTITRNKNANVVCYDARLRVDGVLNPEEPVVAYWLMAAEDGRREALTWLERQLAYGVSVDGAANVSSARIRLKALDARPLSVERTADGRYAACLRIGGKPAVLRKIHVQADNSGITPTVQYVDVFGTTRDGAERIVERIKP